MGKTYDFDKAVDRRKTSCLKYDFGMERKGRDDLLPLWVADMDFQLPEEILADFRLRIDHGIFGYTDPDQEYFDALDHWFFTRQLRSASSGYSDLAYTYSGDEINAETTPSPAEWSASLRIWMNPWRTRRS